MTVTNTKLNPNPEWLFGMNPNAIENQEKQGQVELLVSCQLPSCMSFQKSALDNYKKLGIKVLGVSKGDDIFVDVELPAGWSKQTTESHYWTNLLDEKGRVRASFFYKAAFYDRSAHIDFNRRLSYRTDRIGFSIDNNYEQDSNHQYFSDKTPFCGVIFDQDKKVVYTSKEVMLDVEFNNNDFRKGYTDKYRKELNETRECLVAACLCYLKSFYPKWEEIDAYWDLEKL